MHTHTHTLHRQVVTRVNGTWAGAVRTCVHVGCGGDHTNIRGMHTTPHAPRTGTRHLPHARIYTCSAATGARGCGEWMGRRRQATHGCVPRAATQHEPRTRACVGRGDKARDYCILGVGTLRVKLFTGSAAAVDAARLPFASTGVGAMSAALQRGKGGESNDNACTCMNTQHAGTRNLRASSRPRMRARGRTRANGKHAWK